MNRLTGLDACFVGIPFDSGCSNRTGTRLGPRQIRTESCLLREYNTQGTVPYCTFQKISFSILWNCKYVLMAFKFSVCWMRHDISHIMRSSSHLELVIQTRMAKISGMYWVSVIAYERKDLCLIIKEVKSYIPVKLYLYIDIVLVGTVHRLVHR